jgi:hypothetical protein
MEVEFLSQTGIKVTQDFVIDYDENNRICGGHFVV